jgi:hypothetical protein
MADPVIKVKRSAVAGKIPTTNDLQLGELAINTYDGKVYIEQDQGAVGVGTTIIAINPWSVGVGSNTYNTYFTAGNVGIGSTIPLSALSVVGDGNFSGVITATTFYGDGSNLTGIVAGTSQTSINVIGGVSSVTSLNVTGISTLGSVQISSGIVTAASGIVTYYGDGSKLTGINAVARVTVSSSAPSSPSEGDLWYHTNQARLFVYFDDGSSLQWVDASPFNLQGSGSGANVSVGTTAPVGPSSGDLWYNSDYGRLFVYYRDGDSDQWVDAAPFNYPTRDQPTKTENAFTATEGQTTFTVDYEVGYIEVYVDGVRLTEDQYTATSGNSVILDSALSAGQSVAIVEIATGQGPTGPTGPQGPAGSSIRGVYSYTATGLTTEFTATYEVGYLDVYQNGVHLVPDVDYVGTSGTDFYLITTPSNGDNIVAIGYTSVSLATVLLSGDTSPSLGGNLDLNSYNITGTGNVNVTGVITATSFVGDGSNLTGVSGFATALSSDTTSPLSKIFKTPKVLEIGAGTSVSVESDDTSGDIAFMRESIIHVAVGGTFHIGAGTTLLMNVLNIF